jgi:putative membrane-bound dehydrogenase-like protein
LGASPKKIILFEKGLGRFAQTTRMPSRILLYLLALFLFCTGATVAAEAPPARLLSEPLAPSESLKRIRVLPGFAVDLVASEPLVDSPVAIDWGADGRMWVVEMIDYPTGLDGKGSPGGRVEFLTDSDGDGSYDKATVFLEGLRMPTAVAPWRDGVLVAVAGEILFAADTDKDGKADRRDTLFTGFKEGNPQLRVNGLRWGGDGWIYCASGLSGGNVRSAKTDKELKLDGHDLRINPDTGDMELISGPSQFGRECDDFGNWFGVQNSNPLFHFVLEDRYLRMNLDAPPVDPKRQLVTPPNAPVFAISASRNQFDRTQASPGHPGHFTSACGISIYRDALLFPREDGVTHAFTCEPVHNLVRHTVLKRDGVSFAASRGAGEDDREFLASEDAWFRPVMTRTGPDGALYVVDMYRYMVEHPDWMPAGGPQRMAKLFRAGEGMGRIYRVRREGLAEKRATPDLTKCSTKDLVEALAQPNGLRRDLAQRVLVWGDEGESVDPLNHLLRYGETPTSRLGALRTSMQVSGLDAEVVRIGLRDADAPVRREALRFAERLGSTDPTLVADAIGLTDDPDPVVRLQLACSLGRMYSAEGDAALAKLAISPDAGDPYFAAAVLASSYNPSTRDRVTNAVAHAPHPQFAGPMYRGLIETLAAGNDRDSLATLLSPLVSPASAGNAYTGEQVLAFERFLATLDARGKLAEAFSPNWHDDLAKRLAETGPLFGAARRVAADPLADSTFRAAAVSIVGHASAAGTGAESGDLATFTMLLAPQVPPDVQSAAVKAIARRGGDRVPALLTSDFPALSPRTRGEVLDVLLSRDAWTVEALKSVESGAIPPQQFDPARRQRLSGHKSDAVRTLAAKLFGGGADATARAKVVARRRGALAKTGDATRGLKVFAENCAVCHRFGERGQEVGPDLRSVSAWEPEALLTAILDPNRLVEPRYLSYNVSLNDGQTLFGIITADAAAGVTLKGLDGKEQPVPRAAIKSLAGTNKSLMPDGFEAAMKDQDLADLIAFIKSGG